MAGLDAVREKIIRAEQHLNTFSAEVRAYLEGSKHQLGFDLYEKGAKAIIRFSVDTEPPIRLSVLVGDCVHNARSALDNLACALARLKKPASKCSGVSFPLFTDDTTYRDKRANLLAPFPENSKTFFDGLQPHTEPAPKEHLLAILNRLSNADKHRTPTLTNNFSYNTRFKIHGDGIVHVLTLSKPLYTGTPALVPAPPGLKPGMRVEAQGSRSIAFKDPDLLRLGAAEGILSHAIEFVKNSVVPRFEPLF